MQMTSGKDIRHDRLTTAGAEIHFAQLGAGPDLVLLHAAPSCHEMWLPVANALADRFRITLPDLRAHGQSSTPEGPATMQQHSDDLFRLCRHLGIKRAAFAGVSIGGYALFEFWRSHREQVSALVLCDTKASADSAEGKLAREKSAEEVNQTGPAAFVEKMLPKLLGATTQRNRPDLVEAARHTMRFVTARQITAAQLGMAERPDSTPTLATIDVPALVMVGEEDVITPVADARAIHQGIKGSELAVMAQAGHLAPFERPEETAALLRRFFERSHSSK